jgi:hypothetical protein
MSSMASRPTSSSTVKLVSSMFVPRRDLTISMIPKENHTIEVAREAAVEVLVVEAAAAEETKPAAKSTNCSDLKIN